MNIVCFSGGKDSTALILWAKKNLTSFQVVFCDTGWEDSITYQYIDYINKKLINGNLMILKSDKYSGFEDLSIKKKRVASVMTRFCTQELKLEPTKTYIKRFEDVHLYTGIRAEESRRRAAMAKDVFDKDYYHCWIHRPLLAWTYKDIFDLHKKNKIKPNPLYKKGMKRVGCMPCIMCNLQEMKNIVRNNKQSLSKVRTLEKKLGRSFFSVGYIPKRFCTGFDKKSGKFFPWVDDVIKYVEGNKNQLELFELPSCMSFYGLCE